MDAQTYIELETAKRDGWELPPFCWNDDDEFDPALMYARLEQEGYIEQDGDTFVFVDREKFEQDYPSLFDLLKTLHDAEIQEALDHMVDEGLLQMYEDDDGDAAYSLTELGMQQRAEMEANGDFE
jgi:hypothetical protein